ncbi:MAG: LacI family DNA-binding transcriptional regulator [Anaerolineae bacterium]
MTDKPVLKKKPTQADVARIAGVSQATVSIVLNNNADASIPADTVQRVWDAINQLGYVPNRAAQTLRTHKSYTIAAIIPDITNPFYPAFARGIQDVTEKQGYNLVLYNSDGEASKEVECLISAQQSHVDGIVGVFFHQHVHDLKPFLEASIPIVRFEPSRSQAGDLPLDSLYVDNEAAVRAAVRFLIERGHRRLAIVTGDVGPANARLQGFRQGLVDHQIADELIIESADFTEVGGYASVETLLSCQPRPTAVFAANDLLAIGIMQGVQAAGLHVPTDLAIVGFDDIPAARYVTPTLTTVAQFQEQVGKRAAEMLLEHLSASQPFGGRSIEMPYELKVRAST